MLHAAKELVPRPSLLLYETAASPGSSVNLLASLEDEDFERLYRASPPQVCEASSTVFHQGDRHDGIFIILSGQVRIYYTGPSGREITLAYWSPGNFIGGPEIFGDSTHMWSGEAMRRTELLHMHGAQLRQLIETRPRLAVTMVEALVHKGRCFSALIHMLGTRSAAERMAQLLVLMAELDGQKGENGWILHRRLTQEDLAKLVGSTRQWVSTTLDRFCDAGLLEISPNRIVVRDKERLNSYGS